MWGADYFNHFLLPSFNFRITTGCAILRHFGVELGSRGFLAGIPMGITCPRSPAS